MTDQANEVKTAAAPVGLRGVVAGSSTVSDVNGEKGELVYQGYNIHDLAEHSTFEEVVFLLWHKRLPKKSELSELKQALSRSYDLQGEIIELMKQLPRESDLIDVLRTIVSALELYEPTAKDISRDASLRT